jgi:hypothetical protein
MQSKNKLMVAVVRSHSSHDNTSGLAWDKTAEIVRSINADPAMFVDAQFEAASTRTLGERFPWPNQLHSSSAIEIYYRYAESRVSTPEAMLAEQNCLLVAQLSQNSTLIDIDRALASSILDFKSWFRILMCSDVNFGTFKRVWGEAATRQIINSPLLHSFIKLNYAPRVHRFS